MAPIFCAHGRVHTICPQCKPAPVPVATRPEAPTGRAPGPSDEAPADEAPSKEAPVRGPGRPLTPVRRKVRRATREEAEQAEAWWVGDR